MIMIHSKLHVLMGQHKIKSIRQLSEQTGISRLSLTKLYDGEGKGIEYATLNTLCKFFQCNVGDILVYEGEND
jgi:putative transcriptional regulator